MSDPGDVILYAWIKIAGISMAVIIGIALVMLNWNWIVSLF